MSGLVSIITPSYNSAKYIAETIESVQRQTYSNWEMIIVDDGSSDNTEQIINEIQLTESRIQFFKLDQNSGSGVARNKGIENASGDFMTFIDADDIWFPTFIENSIQAIIDKKSSYVFSSYRRSNENLEFVYSDFIVPHKVTYTDILKSNSISCLTAFVDIKTLGKKYMPKIRKRQDMGLWLQYLKEIPYAYGIQEPQAIYRIRENSLSRNKSKLLKYQWQFYREVEKLNIANEHLVQKALETHGLDSKKFIIDDGAIMELIRSYTREAGVRGLERQIAKILRKVVKERLLSKKSITKPTSITEKNLETFSGVKKFKFGIAEKDNAVGQVTGLAWTEVGGELLTIEASHIAGKGNIIKTGSLGDVMQESIQAALTVVRSRADSLGIKPDFYEKYDVHIHVPEGATPKDGPSAGGGMAISLISAFTGIPVKADTAMTGEITLRGQILKIGGLKEKLLAAKRGGIKNVIIPQENEADLQEIPKQITSSLNIIPVEWIDEVISHALLREPSPLRKSASSIKNKVTKKSNTKQENNQAH